MLLDIFAAIDPGDRDEQTARCMRSASRSEPVAGSVKPASFPSRSRLGWLSQGRRRIERNGEDLGFAAVEILGDNDRNPVVVVETFGVESIAARERHSARRRWRRAGARPAKSGSGSSMR